MIMNKGVHDKEDTVEEKQILTAIPVESKPIFWNTTLRIDQPIKIEATDATVQLQMIWLVIIFLLQDPSKLKLKSNIEHKYSAHNKLEPLKWMPSLKYIVAINT